MKLGKSLFEAVSKNTLLQSCPICSTLGEDALAPIARMAIERSFTKGEQVMEEGSACTGFFLVISGKVRVFKSSASGKEKVLLVAEPGMTFGEDALFGEGVFLQNAEATEKTRVLQIPRTEFLAMLRRNPDLAFQVMESLCVWIRRLSSSVENVAFLSARDKVARYLLELGKSAQPGTGILLPAKKKEVADQLGITPETLSRVLREFEKLKLIQVDKRKITITHPSQLEEVFNP